MIFIKIIISIFLIVGLINPEFAFMMSEGWKFKNAEPSESYILLTRISSVVALIVLWIIFPNWRKSD